MLAPTLLLAFGLSGGWPRIAYGADATRFFLDYPPSAAEISKLRGDRKELIVAKIRILGTIGSLIERDQSGRPPPHRFAKALYAAWIEVIDVIQGATNSGVRFDAVFGQPGTSEIYVIPRTPQMYAHEYFIVSYLGDDGMRHLIGFPVSDEAYNEWNAEVRKYERARGRAGASK
jgi:hypothetical protein